MDPKKWKRQSSAMSLQTLTLDETSSSSPAGSSPASSIHESKNGGFFTSMKRSISRASIKTLNDPPTTDSLGTPGRNVLHKPSGSSSSFDNVRRRSSATSVLSKRQSRALSLSLSSSRLPTTGIDFKTAIDWKTQRVEAHCGLEADPQVLRSKPSYLVVTADYIVKMRSRAEALAAFPQIGSVNGRDDGGSGGGSNSSMLPPPEPILVVPVHLIVSVFMAESSRPSFGIEIWWRSTTSRAAYCSTQAYFVKPQDRSEMMRVISTQLKAKSIEFPEASLVPLEVEARIMDVFAREEPDCNACKPEIFPVVRRMSVREDVLSKDKAKKQQDGASWYLALGRNSCYLAEVAPGLPVDIKYQTFGLVTLDSFRANWTFHEERFVLSFREPFKPGVTLELASRYYRQIVITFLKADRFLKPCWPTGLQTLETFRISGLTDPQLLVAGDNYGGLKRTLDAFLTAYHCSPVEWEINWKTAYAPEFRLLQPKTGGTYTNLQLLAIMRSLRYNGYFNSISFSGVDLCGLWEKLDSAGRTPVPYTNRSCLALSEVELGQVKFGSLLHQEIHALAFCSETVRQLDFTNCFTERNVAGSMLSSRDGPGFLFPILNLLELGLTKCNRLLLSGNCLRPADIIGLVEALMTQRVDIQALDVSRCGLSDMALRDLFEVLFHQSHSLQSLDVCGNRGRVHASVVANLCQTVLDLRKLNVAGAIMGDIPGPMFSFDTLSRFERLEELDLSQYKVNDATLTALERFLSQKPLPSEPGSPPASPFHRLALSNCGVNGREAARLVRSLANHPIAHLHLNGNPLEDGVDDFCRAIALTPGPAGLHMDMVEFRHESSFVALVKALTVNKHISFLSMAGTAPMPPADEPCGSDVCRALEDFFMGNKTVRYLDMSGYSGKLDEGQLAPGFARSLRGLSLNTNLTHLRIRNQNLHDDVGILGSVIRHNKTLRMIDCQENSWNLTSIQFLAKSLQLSSSIVEFPFPHAEYERVLHRVIADLRRQQAGGGGAAAAAGSSSSSSNNNKAAAAVLAEQEAVLRRAVQRQVNDLRETVVRNRDALEGQSPLAMNFEESDATGGEIGWPSLEMKMPSTNNSSSNGGGIVLAQRHSRPAPSSPARVLDFPVEADPADFNPDQRPRGAAAVAAPATATTRRAHKVILSLATTGRDAAESPYHVSRGDATALRLLLADTPPPPSDPLSPLSPDDVGGCSPTDSEMPATPTASTPGEESEGGGAISSSSPPLSEFLLGGGCGAAAAAAGALGGAKLEGAVRVPSYATSFDMGPYFSGSGRDFVVSRFRLGGLEAHEEE